MKFDKSLLAGLFTLTCLILFLCSAPTGQDAHPPTIEGAYVALNIHYAREYDRLVPSMEGHSNLTDGQLKITLSCPDVTVMPGRHNTYTEHVRLTQYGYFTVSFDHTAYLLLKNEGKPHTSVCTASVEVHGSSYFTGSKPIDTVWSVRDDYIEVVQFP